MAGDKHEQFFVVTPPMVMTSIPRDSAAANNITPLPLATSANHGTGMARNRTPIGPLITFTPLAEEDATHHKTLS